MTSPQLGALLAGLALGREGFLRSSVLERRAFQAGLPAPDLPGVSRAALPEVPGGLLLTPDSASPDDPMVFYVHGGGFSIGTPESSIGPAALLAKNSGLRVAIPSYRLAPEHPFPAGLRDVEAAFGAVLARDDVETIAVFGESAGANLALAMMQGLDAADKGRLVAAVLVSGVYDLTYSATTFTSNIDTDVLFDPAFFAEMAQDYAPEGNLEDPAVSPLFGDMDGLPPLFLCAATGEMLRDDTLELARRAMDAAIAVEMIAWPKMPHAWPVFAGVFPEADRAQSLIAEFLRRTTGLTQ